MIPTLPTSICNYYSVKPLVCIILLLSGFIQYCVYVPISPFDNSAYGQEQIVDDERSDDSSNFDLETFDFTSRSADSITENILSPDEEEQQPPDEEEQQPPDEEEQQPPDEEEQQPPDEEEQQPPPQVPQPPPQVPQPPPQVPQPPSVPSTTPTQEAIGEDNVSDQSTGPVKFRFVDSLWTDYTAPGGVVASTSSESITAQPLPPVARQEVEPGQGEAILAVVLRNLGFADATSISGSLDLPSGFKAIVTPQNVDSDTALASYNGIVNAGQTFTLYFRVLVTAETQVGKEYTGELKIRYFRVDEQEEEDTRSTTLKIPFRLSGRVILSTSAVAAFSSNSNTQGIQPGLSNIVSANPGVVNPLRIEISNNGSSVATGVIVDVLPPGTVSSSTTRSGVEGSGSIVNNNNSAESSTSVPSQQVLSSSPSSATMVVVGSPTFNIGIIGANERREIVPAIFPADAASGTLTTLNIQISYNDAYGDRRTLNHVLGIQISPESPQSGLNVLPTSFASWGTMPGRTLPLLTPISFGTPMNNNTMVTQGDIVSSSNSSSSGSNLSSDQPESIRIVAGSVQDLSFAVANNNNNNQGVAITDVVVSLSSESNELRILGDSRWNLQSIGPGSQQQLSTQVYASTSLIGSPVFFTVTMQYIRNGNELRTESFQLGAIVIGNIQISANDVAVSYIGDTPNLVGNLLNEGNSPALFTKIELNALDTQGASQLLQSGVTSQFLGDLVVNSPLAFNIPLQITQRDLGQEAARNNYPISLKITYSDELRNTHEIIVNETISLEPIQMRTGQQAGPSSQQNALLNNGFIDAYWVDSSEPGSTSNIGNLSNGAGTTTSTLPSEREVGPGEGPSFLAVVLSNTAFSDITGIIGYLKLPDGFAATTTGSSSSSSSLNTTNDNSSEQSSSQTSIASLSNTVRAGQTYTLYFKVNVLETAQKGYHEALLSINYFKVPEPQPGTYRVQTVTVPFELPGRVILDASSGTEDLVPGEANEVILTIRNTGSADAHSVIVNINAIGGSIITDSDQATDSSRNNSGSSDEVSADSQSQQQQPSSTSAAVASVGARSFNIGSIPANGSTEIATTVYPSSSAGGTLQNLDIEITYNNANGDRKSTPISIGFRVLPNPPEGGLSVTPSSSIETLAQERIILASTIAGSPTGNSETNPTSNDSSEVTIIAGRAHDMNFNITNNNRNPITDVVVTLVSRSDSLEIIGDSRWTLQELGPQSKARFPTQVFASDTLIGSPVSFEVGIQYISGDQIKSDSFSLGGNVIGEIEIGINELAIRNVGDVPNLTGNLLNQGNTNALFTTIEIVRSPTAMNQSILVPVTYTPQYLGDLEDNSPLPFSIPLATGNSSSNTVAAGNYPVSLKITYSDELRNTHEVILNNTVSYSPPQQEEEAPNQGFLGFGSTTSEENTTNGSAALFPIILVTIVVAALAILLIRRRRSRKKKVSRLMSGRDDNDVFDESLDENLGPSQNNESSHKG
jgi:hypothetical protein